MGGGRPSPGRPSEAERRLAHARTRRDDDEVARLEAGRDPVEIAEAGWELQRQRPPKIVGPVELVFCFQDGRDKRKRDVTNLIKAPEDLLVKHGVIEADDNTIVRAVSACWDDTVEGVEISIFRVTVASASISTAGENAA